MTETALLENIVIKQVTLKAVLIDYEGIEKWIPLSRVKTDGLIEINEIIDIEIPEWMAIQKELI